MDKRNRKKKTVDDTVCEIHKFSGYAVLSNCFVRSTNLGCPAIGLLGRVMDLPPEQKVENPYPDIPSAETPLSENHGQYNTKDKIKNNQLLSDKSSIIPSAAIPQNFNSGNVEKKNEEYNAEEVEYYTEVVKHNIGYGYLGDWLSEDGHDGYKEADEIVGFIVDEICSPLPYTTLRGTNFPRSVIKSKMLQANINIVENVLVNMSKVDNIKDFRRYFISSLYNEVLTYHFNEGCESRWAAYAVARDFGYAV